MRPAERFEQLWRRVSAGTPRAEMGPMPAEVAGSLETALALSRLSIVIEAPAIEDAWSRFAAELDVAEATPVPRLPSHRPVYVVRTFVAVAASFALVVTASLQARPGSALYGLRRTTEDAALVLSPSDTGLHLRLAGARLDDLVGALSDGNEARAPGLAVSLAAERSAAISGGADVSALDARIVAEVPPVLAGAPTDVVRAVTDALSAILCRLAS